MYSWTNGSRREGGEMSIILTPDYSLQVEFMDYGEHGLHCQLFIRKGEANVRNTPPQPAILPVCLELLRDIAKVHEIPEDELAGLEIELQTAFRRHTAEERTKIVLATPADRAAINLVSPVLPDIIATLNKLMRRFARK